MSNKIDQTESDIEQQIQDQVDDMDLMVKLMRSDNVAYVNMLCSVCGSFIATHINRLENHINSTCITCQSIYTIRIELRERKKPPYKI